MEINLSNSERFHIKKRPRKKSNYRKINNEKRQKLIELVKIILIE